jgi:hypothetical protein
MKLGQHLGAETTFADYFSEELAIERARNEEGGRRALYYAHMPQEPGTARSWELRPSRPAAGACRPGNAV